MNVRSVVSCPMPSARACLWLLLFLAGPPKAFPQPSWQNLSTGLDVGRFDDVTVVRVDPSRYEFRLLSAKVLGLKDTPTAPEWADRHRVAGVINASMFQTDQLTSVGYMRDGKKVNNGGWSKDKALFLSQPLQAGLPPVRILDRSCEDAAGLARKYR